MNTGGVVLCGGKSSRMGRPKAWIEFRGETLLARTCRVLAVAVDPIVVVAAPDQELPPVAAPVAVVRDPVEHEGPLRGIAEGLSALPGDVPAAYVSSCDVPLLNPEFVEFMVNQLGDADIAIPFIDGRHHPLAGVYRRQVADTARHLLAHDRRRPIFLFDHHVVVEVTEEQFKTVDPNLDSLRNINTPDEFRRLTSDHDEFGRED